MYVNPFSLPAPDRRSAPPAPRPVATSRSAWAGRIVSGLAVLFLAFDASMKLLGAPQAVQGTTALGWAPSALLPIGLLQLALLVLYLVPRSAIAGAVLWTGYLGGAVATHARLGAPLATHVLFPVYVAALLWGGLFLRDARVKELLRAP